VSIGINTYCFHRLLGDLRPGEVPATVQLDNGGVAALERARGLGCDVVGLQTCYLPGDRFDADALRLAAGEMLLVVEWGHPEGLAFGARPEEETDLLKWLDRSAALGVQLVRVVVGGPRLRGRDPVEVQISRTVAPLRRCAERAGVLGLDVAVENHVDLTLSELVELLRAVDRSNVGICLDIANAVRLGDDPLTMSDQVCSLVRMVHLRDVEPLENVSDPVAGPCTAPYGEGILPLAETLDRLASSLAQEAPILVEIGQVKPGDDELELVASGLDWLRLHREGAGVG
jgi:sugar phosphate isomerase/epimerase